MKKPTPGVQTHREGEGGLARKRPWIWADLVGTRAPGLVRSLAIAVLLLALPAPALASDESELAFHRGVAAFGEGDHEPVDVILESGHIFAGRIDGERSLGHAPLVSAENGSD